MQLDVFYYIILFYPIDCWLTEEGIQTLYLRIKKQSQNAFYKSIFLKSIIFYHVIKLLYNTVLFEFYLK